MLALCLCLCLVFVSCKKDEEPDPDPAPSTPTTPSTPSTDPITPAPGNGADDNGGGSTPAEGTGNGPAQEDVVDTADQPQGM